MDHWPKPSGGGANWNRSAMTQFSISIFNSQLSIPLLPAVLALAAFFVGNALADFTVRHVEIAPRALESRVPNVTAQGRFLAPQAISAVDVSVDGKFITVGTMAFSHDANVWQFGPDGAVIARRHFPPWAPMQVATLSGGRAMAVG